MSNPETYYKVGGIDLSGIFQPLSLGTPFSTQTGYKVGGNDLNTIFAAYTSGTKAITTGYTIPVYGDLNNVFAKYSIPNQISLSLSNITDLTTGTGVNGSITWYKFVLSGTTTAQAIVSFTSSIGNPNCQINFCLIGGGDTGGGNFISNWGSGGGGGGIYYLTNVTFNTSTNFTLQVGQGGLCQISSPFRIQNPTASILGPYTATSASTTSQGSGNYTGGNGGISSGGSSFQNGSDSTFNIVIGNFAGPDGNTYTLGGGGGTSKVIGFGTFGGLAGNGIGGVAGGMPNSYGENASVNSNNFGGGGGGGYFTAGPISYLPGNGNPGAVFLWWNTIQ